MKNVSKYLLIAQLLFLVGCDLTAPVEKKILSKPKIASFDWQVMQSGVQFKVELKSPIELDSLYTDYGLIILDDYGGNYLSDTIYAKGQSELTFFFPRDYFSMPDNVYDSLIGNKHLHGVRLFEMTSVPLEGKLVMKYGSKTTSCGVNTYFNHRIIYDSKSYIFKRHFDSEDCRNCNLVYYKDSLSYLKKIEK